MQTYEMTATKETRQNNRVYVRSMFPKDTPVQFRALGWNTEKNGVLHSLSQGGALVKTGLHLPEVGTQLDMYFKFGNRRIQCQGRVIYHNLEDSELATRGFGVKFTRMISDDYSAIKKTLDEFFLLMKM